MLSGSMRMSYSRATPLFFRYGLLPEPPRGIWRIFLMRIFSGSVRISLRRKFVEPTTETSVRFL